MDCTLAALIACFSWSGLYLDTSAQYINSNDRHYVETLGESLRVFNVDTGESFTERHFIHQLDSPYREIDNPYVTFALGYELNFSRVRIDASVFRQESAAMRDDAETGVSLKVRWFPFRR